MKKLMIYGATGYTGSMIVRHALESSLQIIIAGRDREKLAAMSSVLDVPFRAFRLDNPDTIDGGLADINAVLNCAGPFLHTARPLMEAAIRQKVHYLDVAAELDSYQLAEILDEAASSAGVISLALHITGTMSRGSAVSAAENLSTQCLIRRNGQLMQSESGELRGFDFGNGLQACFPVTLPDVITVWKATGISDIKTFVHISGEGFPQGNLAELPDGPTAQEREASRYKAVAEVLNADGETLHMLLDAVNGYSFTALAAAEAGRRVLAGEYRPGFQTPAALFGKHFAETIADTRITTSEALR